jgi:hypothetical protein
MDVEGGRFSHLPQAYCLSWRYRKAPEAAFGADQTIEDAGIYPIVNSYSNSGNAHGDGIVD